MTDTLLRHWTMLRHVPRHPRKVAVGELCDRLESAGFQVSRRSVERDLQKLSSIFPLRCDEAHKPHGWSWMQDGAVLDLPGMDVHTALAFRMAAEHLQPLLPEATRAYLEPHFQRAWTVLDALAENTLSAWPDKVRVLPAGQALLPPAIDKDVLERVQSGLLTERRLRITYCRRGETETRFYLAHPQGLVWRDAVGYLLCTLFEYTDLIQLALHRIVSVEVEDEPRRALPGFSLDVEVAHGAFDFLLSPEVIVLEVAMPEFAAVKLRETPLSLDQTLADLPDGRAVVRATVANTVQLRSWLLSFGENVEVLEPAALRAEMAATVMAAAELYATRVTRVDSSCALLPAAVKD